MICMHYITRSLQQPVKFSYPWLVSDDTQLPNHPNTVNVTVAGR